MIYYAFFYTFFALALGETILNSHAIRLKNRKYLDFVGLLALILLAGLRSNTGLDYESYRSYFDLFQTGQMPLLNNVFEVGYSLFNIIVPEFEFLIILMAAISIGLKYIAFKRLNIKSIFVIFFFYYCSIYMFYDMGVMRQGVAISFCFLSIPYVVKKDRRFFVCIFFATLFHVSALTFLPVYFMGNKEYSRKFYYTICGVSVAITAINATTQIFSTIISTLGFQFLQHKYDIYSAYGESDLTMSVLKRVVLLVLFVELYKCKKIKIGIFKIYGRKNSTYTWLYINGFLLSLAFLCGADALGFSYVAGRMTIYLYSLHILLLTEIVSYAKRTNLLWLFMFSILSYLSITETLYGTMGNTYLPYRAISIFM